MNTRADRALRRIVIVGGGSAGWMAAAALANMLRGGCKIVLVESDAIGTVGVGEATIPPIKQFIQSLGLDEAEFMRTTGASFKLGIRFDGWSRNGEGYFHPFGSYGIGFDRVPLLHYWLRDALAGTGEPLDDLAMAWAAAKRGRFAHPVRDPRMVQSTFDYAYHFDAGRFADQLRDYAEARGVTRVEGRVGDVGIDGETGFVTHVSLADGRTLDGDFFIDCSGFAALILGQALGVEYRDWSHWLPCDRAVAAGSAITGPRSPYTCAIAGAAGWQWRIPLQHRMGNGHVYCSAFTTDDAAHAALIRTMDGPPLNAPRQLSFRTGRRDAFWKANCLALGLAAGFMEPLESTSLHLVQSAITRFLALFPDRDCDPTAAQEFNRVTGKEYERIRDFLILHYHANHRDEALWQYCQAMQLPDSLAYKIEQFRAGGRIVASQFELFQNASWAAVLVGQGIVPRKYDPLVDQRPHVDAAAKLATLRKVMREAAEAMPTHDDALRNLLKSVDAS